MEDKLSDLQIAAYFVINIKIIFLKMLMLICLKLIIINIVIVIRNILLRYSFTPATRSALTFPTFQFDLHPYARVTVRSIIALAWRRSGNSRREGNVIKGSLSNLPSVLSPYVISNQQTDQHHYHYYHLDVFLELVLHLLLLSCDAFVFFSSSYRLPPRHHTQRHHRRWLSTTLFRLNYCLCSRFPYAVENHVQDIVHHLLHKSSSGNSISSSNRGFRLGPNLASSRRLSRSSFAKISISPSDLAIMGLTVSSSATSFSSSSSASS
ncbi:Protein of unknown function [Cotesia congregata]|uniref:Uncharacterized protein n=1 Tax=Cotesia congregata TaxID=51543 RepID=A0A8J2HCZ6_COTCN|nr:Protein of unknown function [Cotesia congregata]